MQEQHGKTIKKTVIDESHWNGETEKEFLVENTYQKNGDEGYTGH